MKIDFQEKIDNYVLGKMSAEDRDKFEKEVSQDKEKQEQLKLTQNVSTAIKSRNEKLAMMQKWEQERIASKRKIMAWASSAVGIAAVFAIGFFLFVPKEDVSEMNFNAVRVNESKTFGSLQMSNNETLLGNVKPEKLTEERFQFIEQKVCQFLDYLECLQDGKLSTSNYEKALDFLMDSQLVRTLHKKEAQIIMLSKYGKKQEMSLSKYLHKLKNSEISLGRVRNLELYEIDQHSIREIGGEDYMCVICIHAFSVKNGVNLVSSYRETVGVNSETIEALKKNGGVFIGKIEIDNI